MPPLARLEGNVEYCQLYGERGENQQGIDLYARKASSEKYAVYQCKREKNFGSAKIKAAVAKFLTGKWVNQVDMFILCTQESLKKTDRADQFEAQKDVLDRKGISFIPWDSDQLSIKLKNHPDIVEDFFGRAWATAFCGQEQADSSSVKLNLEPITERYREWLKTSTTHFTILGFNTPLSIETAWIQLQARRKREREAFKADYIPYLYHQVVVTGGSGTGKSTFLQRLAYCLFNSGKRVLWVRLPRIAEYYDQGKPFAEAILIDASENSGIEINQLRAILANPDYLLADGLDECENSQGIIAQQLVSWSGGHRDTRVIATTRPENNDVGAFPDWDHIELLPLNSQNIKEDARQLLEARFTDENQIENQLALFEQRLAVSKTASLAAQNPLLLGFLVELSINNVELAQARAGLYESIIELSCNQTPPNREFKVELDAPFAFRVIDIVGWTLQNSPGISEHALVKLLGKELAGELEFKPLVAQRAAQKGLDFWKERRVIERLQIGHQNTILFIHLSLQEYTAGKYAASLTDKELCEWLTQVRQEPNWKTKWTEVILFSAGAGAAERINACLLHLNDLEEVTSIELLLAAKVLAEISKPSLELVETVVRRVQLQLESSSPEVVFEAAETMLGLCIQVPDIIGPIAKSLSKHKQFWTCLAAMRLALECGENYVDLDILQEIFNEISNEPVQSPPLPRLPFSSFTKLSVKPTCFSRGI